MYKKTLVTLALITALCNSLDTCIILEQLTPCGRVVYQDNDNGLIHITLHSGYEYTAFNYPKRETIQALSHRCVTDLSDYDYK